MNLEMESMEQNGFATFRLDAFILIDSLCSLPHGFPSTLLYFGGPLHRPYANDTIFSA